MSELFGVPVEDWHELKELIESQTGMSIKQYLSVARVGGQLPDPGTYVPEYVPTFANDSETLQWMGTDAKRWTQVFMKMLYSRPQLAGADLYDTMVGWFANAIGAGESSTHKVLPLPDLINEIAMEKHPQRSRAARGHRLPLAEGEPALAAARTHRLSRSPQAGDPLSRRQRSALRSLPFMTNLDRQHSEFHKKIRKAIATACRKNGLGWANTYDITQEMVVLGLRFTSSFVGMSLLPTMANSGEIERKRLPTYPVLYRLPRGGKPTANTSATAK